MKRYINKKVAIISLLIVIPLLGYCNSVPKVEVVHPHIGAAVQAVYATGSVEATVMLPIAARGVARLVELNVDEGAEVKKGQILARLEQDDLQNAIKVLEARVEFAQKEYNRKRKLAQQGYAGISTADQAKAELDANIASLNRAKAEADYMQLTAPADGKIIQRDGEIGQLIPSNQAIFWISCCAPLRITAEVDEEDIAQVKIGQEVLIHADAFEGQQFKGKVQSITPRGDANARTYRVRIAFTGENPLQIGMTAETNIIIREKQDAILVPSVAIEKGKIWLVEDGKLKRVSVKLGAKGEQKTEVLEGISLEDEVVVNAGGILAEGMRVRTKMADDTQEKKGKR